MIVSRFHLIPLLSNDKHLQIYSYTQLLINDYVQGTKGN